jgi:hypothetical protein
MEAVKQEQRGAAMGEKEGSEGGDWDDDDDDEDDQDDNDDKEGRGEKRRKRSEDEGIVGPSGIRSRKRR